MNALITRSNEARAQLMAATGLDDLEYNLLILESGCQCLDDLVRPVGTLSKETCELYRHHLSDIGWWTWYEYTFRAFEIRLNTEWNAPASPVPQQDAQWCRRRFLDEAYTLRHTAYYDRAFDTWLKLIEEGGKLKLTIPATNVGKTQAQHVH
jgi:hypothetical protein